MELHLLCLITIKRRNKLLSFKRIVPGNLINKCGISYGNAFTLPHCELNMFYNAIQKTDYLVEINNQRSQQLKLYLPGG
jgi:hypothetical protein